jgi:hypothetical protein
MGDYAPVNAADITDEIVDMAVDIADGWYQGTRIDWEDMIDRLERRRLTDGRGLDFGSDMGSPAINALKRRVRKSINEG